MKTVYTARELMEEFMKNISEPGFYCWTCAAKVEEKDYASHDRENHHIEEEQ